MHKVAVWHNHSGRVMQRYRYIQCNRPAGKGQDHQDEHAAHNGSSPTENNVNVCSSHGSDGVAVFCMRVAVCLVYLVIPSPQLRAARHYKSAWSDMPRLAQAGIAPETHTLRLAFWKSHGALIPLGEYTRQSGGRRIHSEFDSLSVACMIAWTRNINSHVLLLFAFHLDRHRLYA